MFDYLDNVAFAATVCDKDGIVLYQNVCIRRRDGDVVGKNLLGRWTYTNPNFQARLRQYFQKHWHQMLKTLPRMLFHGKNNWGRRSVCPP